MYVQNVISVEMTLILEIDRTEQRFQFYRRNLIWFDTSSSHGEERGTLPPLKNNIWRSYIIVHIKVGVLYFHFFDQLDTLLRLDYVVIPNEWNFDEYDRPKFGHFLVTFYIVLWLLFRLFFPQEHSLPPCKRVQVNLWICSFAFTLMKVYRYLFLPTYTHVFVYML